MKKFVRVIIKDTRNRQLVLKHSAGCSQLWNYPGGKVEVGESAKNAAIREVREEIGVTVAKLRYVTSLCIEIGGERWEGIFYFAQAISSGQPAIRESHKFSDLRFKSSKALCNLDSVPSLLGHVGSSAVIKELRPTQLLS